jgi:phosphoketolase
LKAGWQYPCDRAWNNFPARKLSEQIDVEKYGEDMPEIRAWKWAQG